MLLLKAYSSASWPATLILLFDKVFFTGLYYPEIITWYTNFNALWVWKVEFNFVEQHIKTSQFEFISLLRKKFILLSVHKLLLLNYNEGKRKYISQKILQEKKFSVLVLSWWWFKYFTLLNLLSYYSINSYFQSAHFQEAKR